MVLTQSENQLKSFINEINRNNNSIKSDYEFTKGKTEYLETLVYKDHNNRLQTTFFKKLNDHQNYFRVKSPNFLSLEKSIPYSQALEIKCVCPTFNEYKKSKLDNLERSVLLNKTNAFRNNLILGNI